MDTNDSSLRGDLSLATLTEGATLLLERAGREAATTFVDASITEVDDRRALVLLARLHLDGGDAKGAEAALVALFFWRLTDPWDVEGLALYRLALHRLGRRKELAELDRELVWNRVTG